MEDVIIQNDGCAGRITLNRPEALNALTPQMCDAILAALVEWAHDDAVSLLVIDAAGEKAFCAGGDIAQVHSEGVIGNAAYARDFWIREYSMNAALFRFPKPVVSFMQGYTMGGGVGVGCHGSHRIVDHRSRIAMPECSIGLVTDVGGTLILGRAPGRLGEYLACTAQRMGPEDAIFAGFADYLIPREHWGDVIEDLCASGDVACVDKAALPAPAPTFDMDAIDDAFGGQTLRDIVNRLTHVETAFARATLERMEGNDPLAMAASVELVHRARGTETIEAALEQEFRFTSRAVEDTDFLEGIRARIIDRDNAPNWTEPLHGYSIARVTRLLMPLGDNGLWRRPGPQT